jgi:hypothetical protein
MKKLIHALFSICLVLALTFAMTSGASAAETASADITRGSCGASVTYEFNRSTGILIIKGSGRMDDFLKSGTAPWYKDRLNVKNIIIGEGVPYIGKYAFKYCQAENVAVSSSVKEIGMKAFIYTDRLKQVYYSGTKSQFSAIQIASGNSAFKTAPVSYGSSLSLASVSPASAAITETSSLTYTFSGGVLTIQGRGDMKNYIADMSGRPEWVKYRSQAKSIVIGSGVTSIGDYAFSDFTNVTSVSIPSTVTKIGTRAFYKNYGLKSVVLPDSVTSVGKNAFQNCTGLLSVTLSGSLSEIPAYCFNQCTRLRTVTMTACTTRIGSCAFEGTALETVSFRGTASAFKSITFMCGNTRIKCAMVSCF